MLFPSFDDEVYDLYCAIELLPYYRTLLRTIGTFEHKPPSPTALAKANTITNLRYRTEYRNKAKESSNEAMKQAESPITDQMRFDEIR